MAATADFVTDERKLPTILALLRTKFPLSTALPLSEPKAVRFVRLLPKVISVLDYSKVFGHTDLVEVTAEDLNEAA